MWQRWKGCVGCCERRHGGRWAALFRATCCRTLTRRGGRRRCSQGVLGSLFYAASSSPVRYGGCRMEAAMTRDNPGQAPLRLLHSPCEALPCLGFSLPKEDLNLTLISPWIRKRAG